MSRCARHETGRLSHGMCPECVATGRAVGAELGAAEATARIVAKARAKAVKLDTYTFDDEESFLRNRSYIEALREFADAIEAGAHLGAGTKEEEDHG